MAGWIETEHFGFVAFQVAPPAEGEVRVGETSDADPEELVNLAAERFEHFTDLALEAGLEDDGNAAGGEPFDRLGTGMALRSVNSVDELFQITMIDRSGECHPIFLFDPVAWMGEPIGQFAVVGQHKEAFRIAIETTNVIEVLKLGGEKFVDGGPAQFVLLGTDVAAWFLEEDGGGLSWRNPFSVEPHDIIVLYAGGWVGAGFPIEGHAAFLDEGVAGTPGADPAGGEELVQAGAFGNHEGCGTEKAEPSGSAFLEIRRMNGKLP